MQKNVKVLVGDFYDDFLKQLNFVIYKIGKSYV